MNDKYKYLFPFEKVPYGSNIVIYGAGTLGQEYLKQAMMTNYCKIVAILDKEYKRHKSAAVPILSPEKISELKFDKAVLACSNNNEFLSAKQILLDANVAEEDIIFGFERDTRKVSIYL